MLEVDDAIKKWLCDIVCQLKTLNVHVALCPYRVGAELTTPLIFQTAPKTFVNSG